MKALYLFVFLGLCLLASPAGAQCTETPEAKMYAEKTRTQDAQGCSQCAMLAVYLCSATYSVDAEDVTKVGNLITACKANIRQMGQPYCCPELLGRTPQWGTNPAAKSRKGGAGGAGSLGSNAASSGGSADGQSANPLLDPNFYNNSGLSKLSDKEVLAVGATAAGIAVVGALLSNGAEKRAQREAEAAAAAEAARAQRHADGKRLLAANKAGLTPPKGGTVSLEALRNTARAHVLLDQMSQATAYETKLIQQLEQKALAKGSTPAAVLAAGDAHARPITGQPDYAQQLRWYRRALSAGHAPAITRMAEVFTSRPVPLGDSAVALLRAAANRGNVPAMMQLGEWGKGLTEPEKDKLYYIHKYGIRDKSVNPIESMKWYGQVMATDDEHKGQALLAVGHMYRFGLLDRKDAAKAQEYYESVLKLAPAGVPTPTTAEALRKLYPSKIAQTVAYRTYRRHVANYQSSAQAAQALAKLEERGAGLFGGLRADPAKVKQWSEQAAQYDALAKGSLATTTTELSKLCKCE